METHKIIGDVIESGIEKSDELGLALEKFKSNHQMDPLIEVLDKCLPDAFLGLSENPIRLLYRQLSVGLHSLSDEVCLTKAKSINEILPFAIRRLREQKTDVFRINAAIKNLK